MRFGLFIPPFGPLADPRRLSELAARAEEARWEGVFLWDHVLHGEAVAVADPWIALAAMASATERVLLGPLVTPLPRRRPWVVARQAVTLDHLSGGRMVLGVGSGSDGWREFSAFGEPGDPRQRGVRLDEGLDVIVGLWSGRPVSFAGEYLQVHEASFLPTPRQSPRIPIWVAAEWPNRAPLRRAARYDGVFPIAAMDELGPAEVGELLAYTERYRSGAGAFEVVLRGRSATRADLDELGAAGVTWWLQTLSPGDASDATDALVHEGPPK